ncbi:hypothetical protein BH10ACI1_BH10ACI1_11250 [soil metagenome]
MRSDHLRLFNTALVGLLISMNDDELWNFLLENEERIKFLSDFNNNSRTRPKTSALYSYFYGIESLRERYLDEIEEYREGVIFTLIMDFCFKDEKVSMGYHAQGGYYDNADSGDVKTSDDIMPPVDEESDAGYEAEYFHLLEPHHLENIIQAMEKNFDKLTVNTREDIDKIKAMKEFCRANEGYNAAYVYNL